ncbi:LysR substrate binding domain protein [Synechococcus sp. PCC 7335]|uniref:LysR family transcriptional regulator n=1 Tax=Synechococcus sp. (strain ATCC 29403 / PCC 7335) TaxID=91464 RepID=UPI00017EB52E|nr:LysR family transcriptional regulator [Synechococcus sp. PCC 7335]EDX83550.1 LysR substrate binding domain protein [Synechococcus sp. PCC 7335]
MDVLSLRLFIRIAELGGVTAAAHDLSLSPASASARLVKLEEIVGFRLFNRTTRAVSLTTDGELFLPYAQQTLETLETGLNTVQGQEKSAQGLLRIAMPGSFGRMYIIPLLAEFQTCYPRVRLDLRLSDEVLDVVEGAYDLIIRNAPLSDSSLIVRKLAFDRRLLVASPTYLKQHGVPLTPADLARHRCVTLGETKWEFEDGQTVSVSSSATVNDGEAMRNMIEYGMGIGMKSVWNASESLESGLLVEVLPDFPLVTEASIWLLYPSRRMIAPKVRAMIDFLLKRFWPMPPWEH